MLNATNGVTRYPCSAIAGVDTIVNIGFDKIDKAKRAGIAINK
jgi:hypothetical protein